MKKICHRCGCEKDGALFNRRAASKDGLQQKCRDCERIYKLEKLDAERVRQAIWYQENKEKKSHSARSWYLKNRQIAIDKGLQWLKKNPVKSRQINAKKKAARLKATPPWVDHYLVNGMYEVAALFHRAGLDMEVDHIVPLRGKTVSGLHTHQNLQLMVRSKNASKSNLVWPDMP